MSVLCLLGALHIFERNTSQNVKQVSYSNIYLHKSMILVFILLHHAESKQTTN